jgi:hypothetical protein
MSSLLDGADRYFARGDLEKALEAFADFLPGLLAAAGERFIPTNDFYTKALNCSGGPFFSGRRCDS